MEDWENGHLDTWTFGHLHPLIYFESKGASVQVSKRPSVHSSSVKVSNGPRIQETTATMIQGSKSPMYVT